MTQTDSAMAIVAFQEQLKVVHDLLDEGQRLVHSATRDVKAGTVLMRQTRKFLADSTRHATKSAA